MWLYTLSIELPISATLRIRTHSVHGNQEMLARADKDDVWMHPTDAVPRGIVNGQPVRVFNGRGATILPVRITDRIAPGVVSIEVGYAGGKSAKVSYEEVSGGDTGHAESVRIVFDPHQISYEDLLAHWYFRGHDPTTLNRQNNDVGTQYRSEIFATSDDQRKIAEAVKARVDRSGKWKRPVVTAIEPATTWVRAEDYHQDYLIKHPNGYNDHWLRDFDF
jgi:methionine-S-sulfoxide reductase